VARILQIVVIAHSDCTLTLLAQVIW
jgi:hypothetical protein